jgi:hypothetical protein
VQAGTHGEALRRVADRLRAELIDPEVTELPGLVSTLGEEGGMTGILDAEDEALVGRLREDLAGIASTLSAEADEQPGKAIETTLDGAEFVIRSELVSGNTERLLKLMPSFVFLVAIAVADQDRALELSHRTTELVEEVIE